MCAGSPQARIDVQRAVAAVKASSKPSAATSGPATAPEAAAANVP